MENIDSVSRTSARGGESDRTFQLHASISTGGAASMARLFAGVTPPTADGHRIQHEGLRPTR